MTECEYCKQQIVPGQIMHDATVHQACSEEWDKRVAACLCIVCGKNGAVENERKCKACWESLDFQGYPGA